MLVSCSSASNRIGVSVSKPSSRTPSAGLELLLAMWPTVREALPNASLDVYYGFWPYAMWAEQKPLIELRAQIDPLLKAPGVVYQG